MVFEKVQGNPKGGKQQPTAKGPSRPSDFLSVLDAHALATVLGSGSRV